MTASTLLLVAAAALVAPLIVELPFLTAVPLVVMELLAGIVLGPVLGLVKSSELLTFLSHLGLAFLFFLAGREVDVRLIRGRPLRLAAAGWLLSMAVALTLCAGLDAAGLHVGVGFAAAALCTTALGVVLPILRDRGLVTTAFGSAVIAAGLAGELFPIVQISVTQASASRRPLEVALLTVFAAVVLACAYLALRWRPHRLRMLLHRELHTTSQLPVRACLLLLVALVYLAQDFGLDVVLGAFAAGMVSRLFTSEEGGRPVQDKLEAIGFGFLIPIFFIVSGASLDLAGLAGDPRALIQVPIFLVALLAVRGTPALLYRRELIPRDRLAFALYSSTALPLMVAITTLAVAGGDMPAQTAAALVAAGMLSVLCFPVAARLIAPSPATQVP